MDETLNSPEASLDDTLEEGEKLKGEKLKKVYTEKRGKAVQVIEEFEKNNIFNKINYQWSLVPFLDKKIFNDGKQHLMHHALSFSNPGQTSEWLWEGRDILAEDILNYLSEIANMDTEKEKAKSIMENIMMAVENNEGKVDISKMTNEKEQTLLEKWNSLMQETEKNFPQQEGKSAQDKNKEVLEGFKAKK